MKRHHHDIASVHSYDFALIVIFICEFHTKHVFILICFLHIYIKLKVDSHIYCFSVKHNDILLCMLQVI